MNDEIEGSVADDATPEISPSESENKAQDKLVVAERKPSVRAKKPPKQAISEPASDPKSEEACDCEDHSVVCSLCRLAKHPSGVIRLGDYLASHEGDLLAKFKPELKPE